MKFTLTDEIPHPREVVFATHRDKLVDLVPYLPNITSVEVRTRTVEGAVVKLLNVWLGSTTDVPSVIRPLVKPDLLQWFDRASWDQGRWRCDWEIQLAALPDAVTARGYNVFKDEGDATIIQMQGEFIVHPDRVPGVPAFVARAAAPSLEKFVVGLLEPNLRKSNDAVRQYIDDHP